MISLDPEPSHTLRPAVALLGRVGGKPVVDHLSPAERSRNMAAIRSRDTAPEIALRKALRVAGLVGYRIAPKNVPGRPDVTYTRWKLAVFVDGAYWHGHPDHFTEEKASEYWRQKIARNVARDKQVTAALIDQGWIVLRFWDFDVLKREAQMVECIREELHKLGRHAGAMRGLPENPAPAP